MGLMENRYRDWLIGQVNIIKEFDYTPLLRELFRYEFYSLVKYDEDRAADGRAIRNVWADEIGVANYPDFGPARVLEVLIGIAQRIEFMLFGSKYADDWPWPRIFWDLINNLGLDNMYGQLSAQDRDEIYFVVTLFLSRKYKKRHKGNIFVTKHSDRDLSKLNIWTQMTLYVREKWPI